jgi:hypothetical protein
VEEILWMLPQGAVLHSDNLSNRANGKCQGKERGVGQDACVGGGGGGGVPVSLHCRSLSAPSL